MIEDLGSTNGSYLNRRPLSPKTPHVIRHGDEVVFGKMLVQIYFSGADGFTGF
jgi:pSer/pThr/pTyr-binding forkhead associated (FHA) protein